MEWYHIFAIILGNVTWVLPVFLWVRSESRADIRHMDAKVDSMRELVIAIHLEMKDFHSRLAMIEERRK